MPVPRSAKTRTYDDAPDTAGTFRRMAELPDGPRRRALRNDVIRSWLPMAERLAMRFRGRGENLEDLYQIAALGLVKAVEHYDPDRGSSFESYAVPTVTGEIKRHFRDHMWSLHVPRRVQELRNRVRIAYRDVDQSVPGRAPTVAEVAAQARMSEREAREGMEALDCFAALSLDAEVTGTEGHSLGESVGAHDGGFDLVDDRAAAWPAIAALPERDRTILYLRFFREMTQSAIAVQLGVSQMHVSRLLNQCFARVREDIHAERG
ncbi:SigB/SigF/SigG family RNA polymerase sigma factor [Streptomyces sp. NPDC046860]|uniref:SigB/SigF/SigG family RNA polymerase sigma factor n=1 Tax=Streptomyces sp. NPDC046860 TaxID=3154495 RepID=UPI0033EA6271